MQIIQTQSDDSQYLIELPKPTVELDVIFSQLKLFSKQRLDTNETNVQGIQSDQIKGLKFISSKLAKLFFKNRKLPYNQISKILIDNFASEQRDQRNIKRRVYDAINVLVAAGVLVKKNNSIEMIKNKIKLKLQTDRKDQFQDRLKQKEEIIQSKLHSHNNLIKKHKLIKKLFQRNIKLPLPTFKAISQTNNLSLSEMKTSKNLKRKREQSQNKNIISLNWKQKLIHDPKIVLSLEGSLIDQKYLKKNILKKFTSQNSLQIFVPSNKTYYYIQTNLKRQKLKQNKMDLQENNEINDQIKEENQGQQNMHFQEQNGIFSLMDLLEFLSLDNLQKIQEGV